MSAITLHRIDAAKRMSRFYRLDVQPDLFGEWCFIREWGRIGRAGQGRQTPYPTPAEAGAALQKQRGAKERRGYAASPNAENTSKLRAMSSSASV